MAARGQGRRQARDTRRADAGRGVYSLVIHELLSPRSHDERAHGQRHHLREQGGGALTHAGCTFGGDEQQNVRYLRERPLCIIGVARREVGIRARRCHARVAQEQKCRVVRTAAQFDAEGFARGPAFERFALRDRQPRRCEPCQQIRGRVKHERRRRCAGWCRGGFRAQNGKQPAHAADQHDDQPRGDCDQRLPALPPGPLLNGAQSTLDARFDIQRGARRHGTLTTCTTSGATASVPPTD